MIRQRKKTKEMKVCSKDMGSERSNIVIFSQIFIEN